MGCWAASETRRPGEVRRRADRRRADLQLDHIALLDHDRARVAWSRGYSTTAAEAYTGFCDGLRYARKAFRTAAGWPSRPASTASARRSAASRRARGPSKSPSTRLREPFIASPSRP